jgi:hypothetical protein
MGRFRYGNKVVKAVDLKIKGPETQTLRFPLSDGSTYVVHMTVVSVKRAKDEYNEMGEPIYNVTNKILQGVDDIPDKLYGPASASFEEESDGKKRRGPRKGYV